MEGTTQRVIKIKVDEYSDEMQGLLDDLVGHDISNFLEGQKPGEVVKSIHCISFVGPHTAYVVVNTHPVDD